MFVYKKISQLIDMSNIRKVTVAIFITVLLQSISYPVLAELININKADVVTLSKHLKGVGDVKAQSIVEYRRQYGPFKNVNELVYVPGIGDGILNDNRSNLSTKKGIFRAQERSSKQSALNDSSKSSPIQHKGRNFSEKRNTDFKSDKTVSNDTSRKQKGNKHSKKDKKSGKGKGVKQSKKDKKS